jgi:hypothetical protein
MHAFEGGYDLRCCDLAAHLERTPAVRRIGWLACTPRRRRALRDRSAEGCAKRLRQPSQAPRLHASGAVSSARQLRGAVRAWKLARGRDPSMSRVKFVWR